jgi:hypothetical protein
MSFHDAIDTLLTQLACEYGEYTPYLEYTSLFWTECMFTFCGHIFCRSEGNSTRSTYSSSESYDYQVYYYNDDPLFVFKLKKMAVTASLPLRRRLNSG